MKKSEFLFFFNVFKVFLAHTSEMLEWFQRWHLRDILWTIWKVTNMSIPQSIGSVSCSNFSQSAKRKAPKYQQTKYRQIIGQEIPLCCFLCIGCLYYHKHHKRKYCQFKKKKKKKRYTLSFAYLVIWPLTRSLISTLFQNAEQAHTHTHTYHLCFKHARSKMCHSPKVEDGVKNFLTNFLNTR